jgi:hypothetical protein
VPSGHPSNWLKLEKLAGKINIQFGKDGGKDKWLPSFEFKSVDNPQVEEIVEKRVTAVIPATAYR